VSSAFTARRTTKIFRSVRVISISQDFCERTGRCLIRFTETFSRQLYLPVIRTHQRQPVASPLHSVHRTVHVTYNFLLWFLLFSLLRLSQVVETLYAVARRKKIGGGGYPTFRLSAAAQRNCSGVGGSSHFRLAAEQFGGSEVY